MTYVIAEFGTNYASSFEPERLYRAMHGVAAAHHACADAIKFQIFSGQPIWCPQAGDEQRWPRWNNCVMSSVSWATIKTMCDDLGIEFLASVFDDRALDIYTAMDPRFYKVASRSVETFPYDRVSGPFIISNGFGRKLPNLHGIEPYFLQCSSQYPTPLTQARWDGKTDGISDHSGQVWPAIDAVLRGARFVEVHFATDLENAGPDKAVCLTVEELAVICEGDHAAAAFSPPGC